MEKKQLLGLDVGTDSVGWCLTDENYNVIKRSGKSLWGVRLFEEAKDCKERRSYRCGRRRLQRRKERIILLQSLFIDEINKVDKSFFQRLELSKYHFEDRSSYFDTPQTLFIDKDFNDKKYYHEYPTIYHLRKHLLESTQKEDIRLIYLALHHAIKYRGNFLLAGQKFNVSDVNDLEGYFAKLNEILNALAKPNIPFSISIYNDAIKPIIEKNCTITILKECLKTNLPTTDKYIEKTLYSLIAGSEVNIKDLYELEDGDEEDLPIKKLSFNNPEFDVNFETIKGIFHDNKEEYSEIILCCKGIYNFIKLGSILKGEKYISYAMTNRYDNHKKQLKTFKKFIKDNYDHEVYDNIFRKVGDENNYPKYVGFNRTNNCGERFAKCNKEEFYKFLRNKLNLKKGQETDNPYLNEINKLMESGDFLDKQNSTDNGIFPYQMNLIEIEKIIDNQSLYYPFFNEIKDSLSVKDKIIAILKYQIPYYIGPLGKDSKYGWAVRKDNDSKIYPWNLDKVIDFEKTAEVFITKNLNRCTYLMDEFCLPKNSIQYSAFNLLNELNKLFINGSNITYDQKIDIINNLFINSSKKVNKKSLQDYLKCKYGNDATITISLDKELEEVKSNLNSYNTFVGIFGKEYVNSNIHLIDQIIRDITVFTDKKILETRLKKQYGITDKEILRKIQTLTYSDYGRLSEKLLTGLKTKVIDSNTGEVFEKSILKLMLETNKVFMEVINDKNYDFLKQIEDASLKENDDQTIEEYVDNLYVNPTMKRGIIQSYKIIEELKKITNKPIDEYYVEVTRSNQAKKERKLSRREHLIQLYNEVLRTCKDEINSEYKDFINSGIEDLKKKSDSELRSDKLYLYYIQFGRCMYSNKPISLKDLFNSHVCDIDHIIPQSKVKDDSLENRVLVLLEYNRRKTDEFPIPQNILFDGHKAFYGMLKKNSFIGEKKYHNLLRKDDLSDAELSQFINRQLVSTNQSVIGLIDVIKHFEKVDDTKVIFSKAENVSDYRKKYDILKCREVNDLHHAQDAYLNIVVGRTVNSYFGYRGDPEKYKELHKEKKTTNIKKIYEYNVYRGNSLIYDSNKTLIQVKKQLSSRYDMLVTTRQYVGNTLMEKISIKPKQEGLFPLKTDSVFAKTEKYGGYNDLANGYYCLVKSINKKGKEIITIEAMQNVYVPPYCSKEKKIEYLINVKKLNNPEILNELLRINTVIKDGYKKYCITGKTNDSFVIKNLNQVIYKSNEVTLFKKVSKLQNECLQKRITLVSKNGDDKISEEFPIINNEYILVSPSSNEKTSEIKIDNEELLKMYDIIIEKLNKDILINYSILKSIKEKLESNEIRNQFKSLSMYEKSYTILEMLKLTKCNRELSDLSLISLGKTSGTLTISKTITSSMQIVNESITGFYKKVIKVK